jgi:2-amino-4-hydroxy-6-hydroxymethyldihydropteridine diphosphokinase
MRRLYRKFVGFRSFLCYCCGMTRPFYTIYLALGTNLGDRQANLQEAIDGLRQWLRLTAVSPVYETEPWGVTDQPMFWNMCLAGETAEMPAALLAHCKALEAEIGRVPTRRWGPRLIDIDILFYDDWVLSEDKLSIPHPRLSERAFVLQPLADIAPTLVHPQSGLTVTEMLAKADASQATRLDISIQ